MTTPPKHITPGPLSQIRPGETRIYFAVPTHYTIGDTFASYKEAADAARAKIKTFDYGGCSREFVDVRIADETGDWILHRVEVFTGAADRGTPISELSGRPGHPGFEKFKQIAASWGYD